MLGQLLNWTPSRRGLPLSRGGSHDSQHPLESVTEDAHTLALLFPSPAGFHHAPRDYAVPFHDASPTSTSPFDDLGPDAGAPQDSDVRLLVAQDESPGLPKSILFDSRPPQPPASPASDRPPSSFNFFREKLPPNDPPSLSHSATLPAAARRSSQSQATSVSNDSRRSGSSSSGSSFFRQSADPPRSGPQPHRGHSRGFSSSSVNGLPSQRRLARDADEELQSCLECMFGSAALRYTGKSTKVHILSKDPSLTHWDRSGAASSTITLQTLARPTTATRPSLQRLPSRLASFSDDKTSRKILISRVFAVQPRSHDQQHHVGSSVGATSAQNPVAQRQRRSPVYAASLLIRVPTQSSRRRQQPKSPTESDFLNSWSSSLISDSARSSRGSDSMLESTIFDTNFGSLSSLADALDDEEGMASVTRHWVVISRVLDQLQRTVEGQVLAFRDGAGHPLRRTGSLPMSLNSSRIVQGETWGQSEVMALQPNAFAGDETMEAAAESAATRLSQSFSTRRGVSGQGRWAAWKEEARWVDRWARTSEHSTLFSDLLSAFLATHTGWVDDYDRGKARSRQSSDVIPARTVIVSNNKMKARRFVFLLASFLPRSEETLSLQYSTPVGSERGESWASPVRFPTTSASRMELRPEQTAPAGSRRESRDYGRRYSSRQLSNLSVAIEMSRGGLSRSRTSASFQSGSPGQDRLTSTTTDISTTTPVAHFAPADAVPKTRRGSSASSRLWDNLQFMPPSGTSSQPPSPQATRSQRGSIDSRRDQPGPYESVFVDPPARRDSNESTVTGPDNNKLEQMVAELAMRGRAAASPTREPSKLSAEYTQEQKQGTAPRDIPTPRQKPSDPPGMPFSLSINETDGFVDVDIPLDSYSASLQSLSSRNQSDKGTTSHAGPHPLPARRAAASDVAVGGYLQYFVQDLILQAVRPYNGLEADLRSALESECDIAPARLAPDAPPPTQPASATILVANIDTADLRSLTLHAPAAQPKADAVHPPRPVIAVSRITPDATDASLTAAVARVLRPADATSSSGLPSRAGSLRAQAPSPASSAGGTPPSGAEGLRERERERERGGRAIAEALEEIVRGVVGGAGGPGEGESALRRAVRGRIYG